MKAETLKYLGGRTDNVDRLLAERERLRESLQVILEDIERHWLVDVYSPDYHQAKAAIAFAEADESEKP
jgi:hypothetical protein